MKRKPLALLVGFILITGLTSCASPTNEPVSSTPHTQMNKVNQEWKIDKYGGYIQVSTTRGEVPCIFSPIRSGFSLECDWDSLKTVNDDGSKYQMRENAKALSIGEGWLKFDNSEVWCLRAGDNISVGGYSCDWSTKDKRAEM